ncbi:MAG: hypothetical protein ACLSHO_02945 [Dysosmobacter sp.]
MVELAVNTEDAYALTEPKRRSAPARYEVVNVSWPRRDGPRAAEVMLLYRRLRPDAEAMEKAGLIAFSEEEELRVPVLDDGGAGGRIVLNEGTAAGLCKRF